MPGATRSLIGFHPRRWYVPVAIAANITLLAIGLSLPVMKIEKLIFWEDRYSIVDGGLSLYKHGHYVLAVVLIGFSLVFPNLKLLSLLGVWFVPMRTDHRNLIIRIVEVLGKWSMLDVFVVAVTIVLTQSKSLLGADAQPGLYVFAGAIFLSMLVSLETERIAHKDEADTK